MANVSFERLFHPQTIIKVISELRENRGVLTQFFGMQLGGPNRDPVGGSIASYDIYNNTRRMAKVRPHTSGPGTSAPQTVANRPLAMIKFWDSVQIDQNRVFRNRPIGENFGNVDVRGVRYVASQERTLAQTFANSMEFMVSRMCRGIFYVKFDGDDMIMTDDSTDQVTVDFQVPAGNKDQLDMLGDGDIIGASWATASTNIVDDILEINKAMGRLHGHALRHVFIPTNMATNILENDQVVAMGGSASQSFEDFSREGQATAKDPGIVPDLGFTLRALPFIRFHVLDTVTEVEGTDTAVIENDHAIFLPEPGSDMFSFIEGSEIIAERQDDPGTERYGQHFYATRKMEPAGWDLKGWMKGLPLPYNPKLCVYADLTP